jgi:mRNA interferase RelE/StbE
VAYRIEFTPKAARLFRKLTPDVQHLLARRIDGLTKNPRPRTAEKLESEDNLYRVRQGDYRIVYQIRDKVLLILIVRIGHRGDVYRDL